MTILIVVPIAVLAFFLGFYLNLLIKILVDMLSVLNRLGHREEIVRQQEELNRRGTTFVEPQSLAEIQAQEEMDKIERLNRGENVSNLPE